MNREHRTILREFAFTCPRPIREDEKIFEDRSRSILSSVSAFLKRDVRTAGIWKVSINVNSKNALQHMKVVGGVLRYNIEFDIQKFLELDIDQQKTRMLALVIETLSEVFRQAGWDVQRLIGLENFIIDRDLQSFYYGPSSIRNGVEAKVVCQQKFDYTSVFIILKECGHEIERFLVLQTSSEEFIFNIYLTAPRWVSDVQINLETSNGETYTVRRSH